MATHATDNPIRVAQVRSGRGFDKRQMKSAVGTVGVSLEIALNFILSPRFALAGYALFDGDDESFRLEFFTAKGCNDRIER